ncbi:hypothetical protein LX36DRAFT_591419 [Colletotrichum falcatum]|nr:hypothetical protein LX36DRAFT_591419 [Colletotrichum falcatum]
MAAAVTEHSRFFPAHPDALTADDFETASIRSAAPSYCELGLAYCHDGLMRGIPERLCVMRRSCEAHVSELYRLFQGITGQDLEAG